MKGETPKLYINVVKHNSFLGARRSFNAHEKARIEGVQAVQGIIKDYPTKKSNATDLVYAKSLGEPFGKSLELELGSQPLERGPHEWHQERCNYQNYEEEHNLRKIPAR